MNKRFLQNSGWIIGARIVQMLIGVFVSALTARYLGRYNFGLINYVGAFLSFFTSFATLGLTNTIVKELIIRKGKENVVLGTSITMRLISSLCSAVCIICIVAFLNPSDSQMIFAAFLMSLSLIFQAFEMINYWYQSNLQSKVSSIIQTIAYLVVAGYRIVCLIYGKSVLWFAFATSLDALVIGALLLFSYYRRTHQFLSFNKSLAKEMLSSSHHFIYSGLMVAIYSSIDSLMIKQWLDLSSVGDYSIATGVNTMWSFLLIAFIDSAYPLIVEAKKSGSVQKYHLSIKKLYSLVLWTGLIISTVIALCARPIILILYGEQYINSISCLRICTWINVFAYLGVARGAWMVCENNQKYQKYILGIGCLCNIVFNALFIPSLGINGAAIATIITQVVSSFIGPLFFKKTRENSLFILQSIDPRVIFARNAEED